MTGQGVGKRQSHLITAWIIWFCFLATLGIYVFACHYFGLQATLALGAQIHIVWLRTALYAIAIILFPVLSGLKRLLIAPSSSSQNHNKNITAVAAPSHRYLIIMALILSLAESIGLFGLVLLMLGDSFRTLYIFITMSALAMILHRPRSEELEDFNAGRAH